MGHSIADTGSRENQQRSDKFGGMGKRGALACMVNTEVGAVLAVMRRNARWSGQYDSDDHLEHSLIHSLKSLREEIFCWQHEWNKINPLLYLKPFLDVIRSDETGAPITGVALSAIYKILVMEVFDLNTDNVYDGMHSIVDAVTGCRFEVTDSASEEVVLMKILQVLLACMKSKNSVILSDQDVCTIMTTCFRVVRQAGTKGELLQRSARHTMNELVRSVFLRLSDFDGVAGDESCSESLSTVDNCHTSSSTRGCETLDDKNSHLSNGNESLANNLQELSRISNVDGLENVHLPGEVSDANNSSSKGDNILADDVGVPKGPYGITAISYILQFLCSLLNAVDVTGTGSNHMAVEEDVPLFALGLINSAIELGGPSFGRHPKLLVLLQDDLFSNLLILGLSPSPLILSIVCSIVLNLYHHLRQHIKLQLEAFFSCVVIKLAQGKFGVSYQQQEVAMEALVDFCRQPSFISEMYSNFDCEITCSNVFEDIGNVLSKNAFPVNLNFPLSSMHVLALEGLMAIIRNMVESANMESSPSNIEPIREMEEYEPFWTSLCENYEDAFYWVPFVRHKKHLKKKLMVGADHFNRDPKKGIEFLQSCHLLPKVLEPKSFANFLRYTPGLDKSVVGDFLGNHEDFWVRVLQEFARTFDFVGMPIDMALRTFLETFRLPGESQKIQRVLEAFADRYYEQSHQILADKDAAFVLAYSLILLNTDRHNAQVKKKMTEEDFIRNNKGINGGKDLPREFLSELYHSILHNEIRTTYEQNVVLPDMTPSKWYDLIRKSKHVAPFITNHSLPLLDQDMFAIISGPTVAAMSVVFDHAEEEQVVQKCVDGFLAVAKLASFYHFDHVLDDLVVSLCKFTTLLDPSSSYEEPILVFGEDIKARMVTVSLFTIANQFGDHIRSGWRNIIECIIRLHKLGLLPSSVGRDGIVDQDSVNDSSNGKTSGASSMLKASAVVTRKRSSGLMGRFSQFLYFDNDESTYQPTEQQLAAQQHTMQTIHQCHIDNIFSESKFLHAESLQQLARALVWAAGRQHKNSVEEEDTSVLCLQLLVAITLNNRDRIMILWQCVHDYIANIVQTVVMPCALVEKAVFGLLRVCQRLLPYKENLAEELLRSLQLILKLDARVADVYCERITQEIMHLVKANAGHIKSVAGWRTVASLLSITARHPDASEPGFEALTFIMIEGAHLTQNNYLLCVDAARAFAESRIGTTERSIKALDLIAESANCLVTWSKLQLVGVSQDSAVTPSEEVGEMWLCLLFSFKKVCLDQREEVRNHAVLSLQRCLSAADVACLPLSSWSECFDKLLFKILDELIEISQSRSPKEYRNMEVTLQHAMKMMSKFFLQVLDQLSDMPDFQNLWVGVLNRMVTYTRAKLRGRGSERLQELIPELLKNMLLILKARGVLGKVLKGADTQIWEITCQLVEDIAPQLMAEVFEEHDSEDKIEHQTNPSISETAVIDDGTAGNVSSQEAQKKNEN